MRFPLIAAGLLAMIFLLPSALAVVDPTGIQMYWSFDESPFSDSTGNTTLASATAALNSTAISENSAYCQGTYVQLNDASVLDIPGGVFTSSIWIQSNVPNLYDTNIYGRETASAGYGAFALFWTHGTDLITGRTGSGTTENNVPTSSGQSTQTWINVVFKRDSGGKCYIYVDGNLAGSVVSCVAPQNTAKIFRFCSLTGDYENYFYGNVDEFRLWNRNLTESEITDLYSNPSQAPPSTTTTSSTTTTTQETTTTSETSGTIDTIGSCSGDHELSSDSAYILDYTASSDGTLDYIGINVESGTALAVVGIYQDVEPYTYVGISDPTVITPGWNDIPISGEIPIVAEGYHALALSVNQSVSVCFEIDTPATFYSSFEYNGSLPYTPSTDGVFPPDLNDLMNMRVVYSVHETTSTTTTAPSTTSVMPSGATNYTCSGNYSVENTPTGTNSLFCHYGCDERNGVSYVATRSPFGDICNQDPFWIVIAVIAGLVGIFIVVKVLGGR